MRNLIDWMASDWPLIAALAVCFLAGAAFERQSWRWRRRARHSSRVHRPAKPPASPAPAFDHAEQLRIVERSTFTSCRLLNRGETRLLGVLDQACMSSGNGWRVMAQVSLGEILASPDDAAFRAINSKRVDFLLVDAAGEPQHAIELQGSGHHIGPAATRDAIKKEALRRAGIGYVEVMAGDTPGDVRAKIARLSRRVSIEELVSATAG